MTDPLRRALRRVADPLRDELAESWRVALLIVVLAVAGLVAAVPVRSLRSDAAPTGTALALEPIPAIGPVVGWTGEEAGPAASRAAALAEIFPVLEAVAWATLAAALIAVFGRLVAQAYQRGPEIGIRRAVGASRAQVLAAQLAEAGLVAAAIALLALPLAFAAWRGSAAAWPGPVTGAAFTPLLPLGAAAGVLALGALLPLAHRSARRLVPGDPLPVTLALPAAQIAASLAVLTAAAVMLRHAESVGAGAAAARAAGGRVLELAASDAGPEARAAAYRALLTRLAATQRYPAASLASRGAHLGLGTVDFGMTDCGQCARGMVILRWLDLYATHHAITPDTFAATGIRLLEGRGVELADDWDAPRIAVVNRHLAARYFQNGKAVGRDIYVGRGWPRVPHRVVGIVDDERPRILGGAAQPRETVYLSALQHPPAEVELLLRPAAGEEPDPLLHAALGGAARVERTTTEAERVAAEARPLAWFGRWFGGVGLAALVVAVFAAFDTVRLWVRSIAGELALRRAAGATRRQAGIWVAVRAALAVLWGAAAGVALFATLLREYLVKAVPALEVWHAPAVLVCGTILVAAALAGAASATRQVLRTAPARWLH